MHTLTHDDLTTTADAGPAVPPAEYAAPSIVRRVCDLVAEAELAQQAERLSGVRPARRLLLVELDPRGQWHVSGWDRAA